MSGKDPYCPGCKRKLHRADTPIGSLNVQRTPDSDFWFAMCVDCTKKHNLGRAQLVERRVVARPEWYARDKYREVVMSLRRGRG